jgi:Rps23 Pro-64 3,4-dihydroxylase Tpa1-like proline 4-hydroxylase
MRAELPLLREQWCSRAPINHLIIDDLLPSAWASAIRAAFPPPERMTLKRSLRETKYIAAQMSNYDPLLEEAIYAFQDARVLRVVEDITQLKALQPDHLLYAGGISMMAPGHYLNPHIDNSHDKARQRYRVLNLLYYVSPAWEEGHGANLELWPGGPRSTPVTITSRFNRLVVMVTHQSSWHSVSMNRSAEQRCCVSNYYFSDFPVGAQDYFHVTSFRGRPDQRLRDLLLRADDVARTVLRKLFPLGVRPTRHFYDKRR